jgi:hypothetical protein
LPWVWTRPAPPSCSPERPPGPTWKDGATDDQAHIADESALGLTAARDVEPILPGLP